MNKSDKLPAVLGVGNALMDIITQLEDDSILKNFGLPRGSMTLVDTELSSQIFNATLNNKKEVTNGGSAANTIRCLASLGGNGGYIGKTGNDELGKTFKDEFTKKGIKTHMALSEKDTGRVMGLISKDSERTMATYLGAAADLLPDDLNPSLLRGYKYFYMEGYLVQNHDLIRTGFEMAKAENLTTAIDLASFNVVEANLDFLKELIKNSVDIVFANEEEAHALTGKHPEEALEEISQMCDLAIVKVGKEGSFVKNGTKKIKVSGIPAKAIDTTGAGDSYAAGFLYGLTNGFPLEKCGKIASLVAGKVVEVWGANLPDTTWKEINTKIKEMD